MVQVLPQPQLLLLQLPEALGLNVTQEQFVALAAVNHDLRLERTATGELIVNPPTGGESGKRNLSITGQLSNWFESNETLGAAFDSSTGFKLPNGANRSPDASWVRRDRWEALTPEQREGFMPLCPDFVVELRSRTDSLTTLRSKMQEYFGSLPGRVGTRGWLVDDFCPWPGLPAIAEQTT